MRENSKRPRKCPTYPGPRFRRDCGKRFFYDKKCARFKCEFCGCFIPLSMVMTKPYGYVLC